MNNKPSYRLYSDIQVTEQPSTGLPGPGRDLSALAAPRSQGPLLLLPDASRQTGDLFTVFPFCTTIKKGSYYWNTQGGRQAHRERVGGQRLATLMADP